jgi:tetratricopeptide (TPR) repeat protein
MPKHWTGRKTEMDSLDAWLSDDGPPMCSLIAMGGTGKSSLAWAWLKNRVLPRQEDLGLAGVFQWSFYEGDVSFQRFLADLSAYLGVSTSGDLVTALTQRLCRERILLVLDGFERLLLAYTDADAALLPERTAQELRTGERRCADRPVERFLTALICGGATKTLLASRLVPEELDGKDGWQPLDLPGLDPEEAADYLEASGIRGTRHELKQAAEVYACHPLSLSKLVTVLHYDPDRPDDVRQAERYSIVGDLKARQHHILERAYETLPADVGQFLSALAALRTKPSLDVAHYLAPSSVTDFSADLKRLEDDRWIRWERDQGTLDFHPLVRQYAYGRLKEKEAVHERLVAYFRPLAAKIDTRSADSLAGLAPVIELYHHTVGAERYDDACDLFHDRLASQLYFRFGAYATRIELLRGLFPDGENKPPRLKNPAAQAWTLNALANSYGLSGQSRRAVPLFKMQNTLQEKTGSKVNVAIGLGNLANNQAKLGELAAAEENVRRRIALCRELKDEFEEAVGHQELGRLLAYEGVFDQAAQELDAALGFEVWGRNPQGVGINWAYRAFSALLMDNAPAALDAARHTLEFWERDATEDYPVERDFVRVQWLLGWAHVALAIVDKSHRAEHLAEAETCLTEALTRCRRINNVESEPDILLTWARWHRAKGDRKSARAAALEALSIADRSEYRLVQADCHNFLARLALDSGDDNAARKEAEVARERAGCDGPGHSYKPALDEADRLLAEL